MEIVFGIFLILTSYLFLIMPRLKSPDVNAFKNCFYAHRGLYDNINLPENSLGAFSRAVDNGYGIELDVQVTKDFIPIVFHDFSLKRLCGIDKEIEDMPYEELKRCTLLNTDETIPTLEEVLTLVHNRVPIIVEIKTKSSSMDFLFLIADMLEKYEGRYCIESFNPLALCWYKMHYPHVVRGQLSTPKTEEICGYRWLIKLFGKMLTNCISRPDFIAYDWHYRKELSRQLCRKLYKKLSVAWTIQSQEELEVCRKDFDAFIFEGFIPQVMIK